MYASIYIACYKLTRWPHSERSWYQNDWIFEIWPEMKIRVFDFVNLFFFITRCYYFITRCTRFYHFITRRTIIENATSVTMTLHISNKSLSLKKRQRIIFKLIRCVWNLCWTKCFTACLKFFVIHIFHFHILDLLKETLCRNWL